MSGARASAAVAAPLDQQGHGGQVPELRGHQQRCAPPAIEGVGIHRARAAAPRENLRRPAVAALWDWVRREAATLRALSLG